MYWRTATSNAFLLTYQRLQSNRTKLKVKSLSMVDKPKIPDGEYSFISERFPLTELAWIEVSRALENLLRDHARARASSVSKSGK
jgi:hypothetical protein